jgi:hypothetical protein
MSQFKMDRHLIDEMVMRHEPLEPAHNRAYDETQEALSALNELINAEIDKIHDRMLLVYREGMKHGIRLFLGQEVFTTPCGNRPGYIEISVGDLPPVEVPVLSDRSGPPEDTEYFTMTQKQRDAWVADLMKQIDHAVIVEGSERHRELDPTNPIFE